MSCDLHIHSTCSDGAVPIERLASIAARTALHAIALSDHDTLLSAQYAYAHTGRRRRVVSAHHSRHQPRCLARR